MHELAQRFQKKIDALPKQEEVDGLKQALEESRAQSEEALNHQRHQCRGRLILVDEANAQKTGLEEAVQQLHAQVQVLFGGVIL